MSRVAVHNRAEEASQRSPRFARPVTVLKITIPKTKINIRLRISKLAFARACA